MLGSHTKRALRIRDGKVDQSMGGCKRIYVLHSMLAPAKFKLINSFDWVMRDQVMGRCWSDKWKCERQIIIL